MSKRKLLSMLLKIQWLVNSDGDKNKINDLILEIADIIEPSNK